MSSRDPELNHDRKKLAKRYDSCVQKMETCRKMLLAIGMDHLAKAVEGSLSQLHYAIENYIEGKSSLEDQKVIDLTRQIIRSTKDVVQLFKNAHINDKKLRIATTEELLLAIDALNKKAIHLSNRGHIVDAAILKEHFHHEMKQDVNQYREGKITLEDLQRKISDSLYQAQFNPAIKQIFDHRALKPLTKNILLAVGTLGIGYLAAGLVQLGKTKGEKFILFREQKTDTTKKLEKVRDLSEALKPNENSPPKLK